MGTRKPAVKISSVSFCCVRPQRRRNNAKLKMQKGKTKSSLLVIFLFASLILHSIAQALKPSPRACAISGAADTSNQGSFSSPRQIRTRSCKTSLMSSSGQSSPCILAPDPLYLEELKRHFAMLSSSARMPSRTDPWRRLGVSPDRLPSLSGTRRTQERRPYPRCWWSWSWPGYSWSLSWWSPGCSWSWSFYWW